MSREDRARDDVIEGPRAPSSPEDAVAAAHELCARCEWTAAYDLLVAADARGALDGAGLELLADCARWAGLLAQVPEFLERAYHAYAGDDPRAAARAALGLCYAHLDACAPAQGAAWWRRADELIAGIPEGPEHGLHAWFSGRERGNQGDLEGHEACARRALEIGRRHGDRNVEALALIDLAHVAAIRGESTRALDLLDGATALALGGEIGILETGLVFCNAIFACRARGAWDRAQEWTSSSTRWVSRTRVSYFPGLCRVHRAEVLRVRGELDAAECEAQEAARLLRAAIPRWLALACVELGEIRRRLGDLAGALEAYREVLAAGWDPQPGLALLMLAQGDAAGAHRALERFCGRRVPTLHCEDKAGLLKARVTVALAAGAPAVAEAAAAELVRLAAGDAVPWDRACAAQAQGELALARGDAGEAIARLHDARAQWAEVEAPYEQAACGMLAGRAMLEAGDVLGATLELEAARGIFARLGAARDREACEALLARAAGGSAEAVAEPEAREAAPAKAAAALVREGDVWAVAFDGATLRVKDGRGPRYLARLLAEPERDFLALDLAGGEGAPEGDAGEILDPQARAAYRARLTDLRAELDEATGHNDRGRVERCQAEIDALTAQLVEAVGLGGRARRAGDARERARQSVTKALKAVIRRIADEHEALGRYLSATIRTGILCRFDPDPGRPVHWRVEE